MVIAAEGIDAWIESEYPDLFGDLDEYVAVRAPTERTRRIAELTAQHRELSATIGKLRGTERREALDVLEAAEVELDDLRSRPVSRLSMLRETGCTREQAWNESSLVERRESLRR